MPLSSKSSRLTPLETEIMKVLWDFGPATVQDVQLQLPDSKLAYTTVQTMLNILHRKGRVKRRLKGKAYRYEAVLSREKAISQSVGDLAERLFGGSVDALLMSLVKHRQIDRNKLEELSQLIEARLNEREDEDGKA